MCELALAQEAAVNAQRAETAEKARATRFQRWAQLAGAGIVIALVLLAFSAVRVTDANSQLATVEFGSTVSAFEGQRISTLVPGLGQFPPTLAATIPPNAAFITATQIAVAYGHDDDVVQEFDGVPMVLVPAGCFFMGSAAFSDAVPVTQCVSMRLTGSTSSKLRMGSTNG